MNADEMALFSAAQVGAGYLLPEINRRGDGWLFERDHDRFVGWQLGREQERERLAAEFDGWRDDDRLQPEFVAKWIREA